MFSKLDICLDDSKECFKIIEYDIDMVIYAKFGRFVSFEDDE